ncbi:MAG TPA: NADH-dependent [FeFe] hydrogenase, group A6 [Clostridia bacterium]|nr:NADH-dependent [FeFe] hydrogenase, group A6 [Clostridia bacterium]
MSKVSIQINGESIEVEESLTVLEACKEIGIDIPTLCYLKGINEVGSCRMCVVEVEGRRNLEASCVMPVREGMSVKTSTKRVRESRKTTLELLLASHERECLTCVQNNYCELQKYAEELGVDSLELKERRKEKVIDEFSPSIVRDSTKCILCGRCVNTCKSVQGVGILEFINRGFDTVVAPAFSKSLSDVDCLYCGQCVTSCPVGALSEKNDTEKVWDALEDPNLHVIVQTAPAVRAGLGELFQYPMGTRVTGKMVTALKRLGFDKVFDTNFAADLTIMEEGTELLGRINNGGVLPMITSCSPGWIRYCEYNFPELLDHLSTCKSPQQMFGAIAKSYYAEKFDIDPKKIFVVSIMPCTAKKSEREREEMAVEGLRDVDVALTTRELGAMIKEARLNFHELPDSDFDKVLGEYTGAGVIFGATGGVMEAALRTVADVLTGEDLEAIEYEAVRGTEGIKEASVEIGDLTVNVAIAHSTSKAKELLESEKFSNKSYHFIEIMACPGGCVNGGGQPYVTAEVRNSINVKEERAKALYEEDKKMPLRKSHKNPEVIALYEDFLGEPNSHKAHELLHTHYSAKDKYNLDKINMMCK